MSIAALWDYLGSIHSLSLNKFTVACICHSSSTHSGFTILKSYEDLFAFLFSIFSGIHNSFYCIHSFPLPECQLFKPNSIKLSLIFPICFMIHIFPFKFYSRGWQLSLIDNHSTDQKFCFAWVQLSMKIKYPKYSNGFYKTKQVHILNNEFFERWTTSTRVDFRKWLCILEV